MTSFQKRKKSSNQSRTFSPTCDTLVSNNLQTTFIMLHAVLALMCVLQWLRATVTQALTSILLVGLAGLLCVLNWTLPPRDIKAFLQQLFESHTSVSKSYVQIYFKFDYQLNKFYYFFKVEKKKINKIKNQQHHKSADFIVSNYCLESKLFGNKVVDDEDQHFLYSFFFVTKLLKTN